MKSRANPFLSLQNKDYRLFLIGFFVSQMGSQMQVVAVNWQIYQITHSAIALGLVGLASFLPTLLLSLFGGITADRMERKKLLTITQIFLAFCSLMLASATYLHLINPLLIFVIIFLNFAGMAFYSPVRQSIIPNLVPSKHLLNAVSLNTLTRQSAIIVGPAIAGFLIAFYGVESIYLINTIAFIIMIITILPIKIPAHIESKRPSYDLKSVMEGLRFVKGHTIISSTILLDFVATFFSSATSLLPIFAADILHVSAQGLGALYAATSAGGVLAGLIMSTFNKLKHQGWIILGSVVVYGLATIGFGLSTSFYLSLFFLALLGAGDMTSTILRNTIRQALTPDHIRGRMVGINILFAQGGPKLGDAEAGLLAAAAGAPLSVVLGGVATVIATLIIGYTIPKLRNFKNSQIAI
jgi:MFS family permease